MTLNLKNVYGIDPPKSALETGYIGFKARYFGLWTLVDLHFLLL